MAAKDYYHDAVRGALVKDGWIITHDPFTLSQGIRNLFVDLGAERPIAAEKAGIKIAVEIKSFSGCSMMRDFQQAMGQYLQYRSILRITEPDRRLILAVPELAYLNVFDDPLVAPLIAEVRPALVVYQPSSEEIIRWIL